MEEKLLYDRIKELCLCSGAAVDRIAKECGINQTLVAKMFINTFKLIIDKMEGE